MKASMTLFGCGPKLALVCLPYVILSLVVMYKGPEFLELKVKYERFKRSVHGTVLFPRFLLRGKNTD